MQLSYKDIRLLGVSCLVLILYLHAFFQNYTPPIYFLISITAIYLSSPPEYIFHPKNVLFGYSFLWYTIPMMFAARYQDFSFREEPQVWAYCMLIMTFVIGYNTLHFTIKRRDEKFKVYTIKQINRISFKWTHIIFILLSLFSCYLTMALSQHGVVGWLKNPGAAFQTRGGAGIATILLIFTSGIALTSGGYYLKKQKHIYDKFFLFIIYSLIIVIYLTCLLHRQRLLNFYILLFLSSLFFLKMKFRKVLFIGILALFSIYVASFIRAGDILSTAEGAFEFFFNYFDTYEALVISLKDIEPSFFGTSFMAFRKLFIGMGYDPNMPYSISQWLTPIYFPEFGERTTVQFPIETEMYLNGWYFCMIPVLLLYFWMVGYFYKYALQTKALGAMFVSLYMMLNMIGHLRGMFIEFPDFYNYPIMIISYFLLNKIHHKPVIQKFPIREIQRSDVVEKFSKGKYQFLKN